MRGTGGIDLEDLGATGRTVTIAGVKLTEGDVVGGVHDDRKHVLLAHAHSCNQMVLLLDQDFGVEDLRGEALRVGVEVSEDSLEVCRGRLWGEGGAAPMVKESTRELGVCWSG